MLKSWRDFALYIEILKAGYGSKNAHQNDK